MAATYTRRINLYINGKQVSADIVSIRKEMAKLVNEQARMTIGSKEYVKHTAKIKGLKTIIDQHNQDLSTTHKQWNRFQKLSDAANRYFAAITAGVMAVTAAVMTIKSSINAFAEYDDKLVDVMKTTDLTKQETKELSAEIAKINTRTAHNDLLELARVAGKLGHRGKEDVLGFVRATDQIRVALSEDLGGDTEESVRQLGKLVEIFKVTNEFSVEESLLKIGSAMNALGASGTANEGYMLEFTKRVAGVAPTAGITIDKVLGLATTLDELGQTSEVSGTAISQVLSNMFKKTSQYAKVAGMEVEEFTKLMNEDANEALIQLLVGARGSADGFGNLAKSLSTLGMDGVRATNVLGVLAANIDKLRENQKFSNEEFIKGNSLNIEFNKKNSSAQAIIEKNIKIFKEAQREFGEKVMPLYGEAIHKASTLLKLFSITTDFLLKYGKAIVFATGYLIAYTIAVKALAMWEARKNAAVGIGLALSKAQTIAFHAQFAAIALYNAAVALLTGRMKLAAVSVRAFSAALNATPLGWVFTAIGAVVLAIQGFDKYLGGATQRAEQKAKALNDLRILTDAYTEHLTKLNNTVKDSNSLSLERKKQIAAESNEMIDAIENTIRLQKLEQDLLRQTNTRATLWQKTVNLFKAGANPYMAAAYNMQSAVENGQEAADSMNEGIIQLQGTMVNLKGTSKQIWEIVNAESIADKIGTESLVMMNEKLAKYRVALENSVFQGKDYIRIQQKIMELEEKMNRPVFQSEDDLKEKINTAQAAYSKLQSVAHEDFLNSKINQDQYNDILLKGELDFMDEKLKIYEEGSNEYEETLNKALQIRVKNEIKLRTLQAKSEKDLQNARIANIQEETTRLTAAENQRWKVEKATLQGKLIKRQDLSNREQAHNSNIYKLIQQKEITHQKKLADIKSGASTSGKSKPWRLSDNIKLEINVLTALFNKKQALIRQDFLEGKMTEDEYEHQMLQSELQFHADKLNIYNEGTKQYQEAVNKALELQVKVDLKLRDLQLKVQQELADSKIENIRDEFERQEEQEKERWEQEKTALEKQLIDKAQLNEKEQAINDAIHKIIEEKEKTHQQKMTDLKTGKNIAELENKVTASDPFDENFAPEDEMQKSFNARAELAQAMYTNELNMAAGNHAALLAAEKRFSDSMLQIKLDMVDAEWNLYEQKIQSAQAFSSALGQIVEQDSELGKALFAFNQGLAIAEIWVSVAKANAKALALAPVTSGQPFITMNTGVGVAQTALVMAQTFKEFSKPKKAEGGNGYYGGGPTPPGPKFEPAGIVHKGEYVLSQDMLADPNMQYLTSIFEKMRTRKISLSQAAMPLLSSGGFARIDKPAPVVAPQFISPDNKLLQEQNRINAELTKAITLLMTHRPTVAVETIEREREKYIQIKQTKGL